MGGRPTLVPLELPPRGRRCPRLNVQIARCPQKRYFSSAYPSAPGQSLMQSVRKTKADMPSYLMRSTHLRSGDVVLSRLTSGSAAGTTAWAPVTISLAPISLPYSFLLASLSVSIDAPARDTPAKSPLDRE